MKINIFRMVLCTLLTVSTSGLFSQSPGKGTVAVIQASALSNQDLFMVEYDPLKVRAGVSGHLDKLLGLFEKAGEMGADLVCGPEDMQNIGSYGLFINVKDKETGKILFNSLAVKVPGELTDRISAIARKYTMYIIAPIYEEEEGKIFNSAVVFDREGKIMGKHHKTVLPIMETWLVSTGDKYEVFQTDFCRIAVATCWEISYPEISTIYALGGADIIFNPTMAPDNIRGKSLSTAPMFVTRARDNSVYIAPVVLGKDGNGIIDFDGNVVAEDPGKENTVIMAEIDFSRERLNESQWWRSINGTDNIKAMHLKSRRPETYRMLTEPNPPVLEKYKDIHLTTGDKNRQLKAVRDVDYGPNAKGKK